jgi:hypothetical protein
MIPSKSRMMDLLVPQQNARDKLLVPPASGAAASFGPDRGDFMQLPWSLFGISKHRYNLLK